MKCTDIRTYDVEHLEVLLLEKAEPFKEDVIENYGEVLEEITALSCELYRRSADEEKQQ